MFYKNTNVQVIASYSNSDMDSFDDGTKIEFSMCVPIKYHKDIKTVADNINNLCAETARNLLIINGVNFREYMIKVKIQET